MRWAWPVATAPKRWWPRLRPRIDCHSCASRPVRAIISPSTSGSTVMIRSGHSTRSGRPVNPPSTWARSTARSSSTTCRSVCTRIVASDKYREAKRRTVAEMLPDLMGPGAPSLGARGRRHRPCRRRRAAAHGVEQSLHVVKRRRLRLARAVERRRARGDVRFDQPHGRRQSPGRAGGSRSSRALRGLAAVDHAPSTGAGTVLVGRGCRRRGADLGTSASLHDPTGRTPRPHRPGTNAAPRPPCCMRP